jgi:hypothetical protein
VVYDLSGPSVGPDTRRIVISNVIVSDALDVAETCRHGRLGVFEGLAFLVDSQNGRVTTASSDTGTHEPACSSRNRARTRGQVDNLAPIVWLIRPTHILRGFNLSLWASPHLPWRWQGCAGQRLSRNSDAFANTGKTL